MRGKACEVVIDTMSSSVGPLRAVGQGRTPVRESILLI